MHMDKQLVEKIVSIASLSHAGQSVSASLDKSRYAIRNITEEDFLPMPTQEHVKHALYVDAGNAEIFSSPRACLHAIRVYATLYQDNKRSWSKSSEFYFYARLEKGTNDAKSPNIILEVLPGKGDFMLDRSLMRIQDNDDEEAYSKGRIEGELAHYVDVARRFSEITLAQRLLKDIPDGSMVVFDGTLEAFYKGEAALLADLYSEAALKNVTICSLAKTSGMLSTDGYIMSEHLMAMKPAAAGSWHVEVASSGSHIHNAIIMFARLHTKSKHAFKLEICGFGTHDKNKVLSCLSANSKDIAFPGYPYGLVDADRHARISNREAEYYRTVFMARAGKLWYGIEAQLKSVNAHSILDSF